MAENTTKNESKKKNTILADEDDDDEEEDPFYTRIDQSGCSKYHYALQVVLCPSFLSGTDWLSLSARALVPCLTKPAYEL